MTRDAGKGARFLIYLLSTFGFGAMPMVWRWGGDYLVSRPHVFQNFLTLPEGYIFAFLVSAATFTESALRDEWRGPFFNCLRVLVIGASFISAVVCLTLYVAMLSPDYPAPLRSFQVGLMIIVSLINIAYVLNKVARTDDGAGGL